MRKEIHKGGKIEVGIDGTKNQIFIDVLTENNKMLSRTYIPNDSAKILAQGLLDCVRALETGAMKIQ